MEGALLAGVVRSGSGFGMREGEQQGNRGRRDLGGLERRNRAIAGEERCFRGSLRCI